MTTGRSTSRMESIKASSPRARRSRPGSSIGSPATSTDPLEGHVAAPRLARAPRLFGQRRAGVEQRLPPALDVGAALDVLELEQLRQDGMPKHLDDEPRGPRPAPLI